MVVVTSTLNQLDRITLADSPSYLICGTCSWQKPGSMLGGALTARSIVQRARDRHLACRFLGAEDPDQPAHAAEDKIDRAVKDRYDRSIGRHESGIAERHHHRRLAQAPA